VIPVALSAAHPQPIVDALGEAVRSATDIEQLYDIHDGLPPDTIVLASVAVDVSARVTEIARQLAARDPETHLPMLASR
jgi:hypothetical protein